MKTTKQILLEVIRGLPVSYDVVVFDDITDKQALNYILKLKAYLCKLNLKELEDEV